MYDDDKKGYTNGCIHYPLKKRDQIDEKKLSPLEVMLRSMVGKQKYDMDINIMRDCNVYVAR